MKDLPPGVRDWPGLRAPHLILALDYDGTLVPIQEEPEQARPDPDLLGLLRELARKSIVVILTGRNWKDMARWIRDPAILLVTSHGAEWRHKGRWTSLLVPEDLRGPLKTLARRLEETLGHIAGVAIEEKGSTVAFHYRRVETSRRSSLLDRLDRVVGSWMDENAGFEVLEGKCIREVRPQGLNKGAALCQVLERLHVDESPVLAMGDDQTDEDMFHSLRDGDLAVHVGPGTTSAPICLRDVCEAREVLKTILTERKKSN